MKQGSEKYLTNYPLKVFILPSRYDTEAEMQVIILPGLEERRGKTEDRV